MYRSIYIQLCTSKIAEQLAEHIVPRCQPAINAKARFCKFAFTLRSVCRWKGIIRSKTLCVHVYKYLHSVLYLKNKAIYCVTLCLVSCNLDYKCSSTASRERYNQSK